MNQLWFVHFTLCKYSTWYPKIAFMIKLSAWYLWYEWKALKVYSSLSDVGIKKQLQLLHRKQKEYEQSEKKLYSSMFRNWSAHLNVFNICNCIIMRGLSNHIMTFWLLDIILFLAKYLLYFLAICVFFFKFVETGMPWSVWLIGCSCSQNCIRLYNNLDQRWRW